MTVENAHGRKTGGEEGQREGRGRRKERGAEEMGMGMEIEGQERKEEMESGLWLLGVGVVYQHTLFNQTPSTCRPM